MQNIDYKRKYIFTYIWQALSILLGFLSLFVVIPFLSSDKSLYGIYSVCTSLTIFFSYADLGFISAGIKYAAEYYIRGEQNSEIKIIGFVAFIVMSTFLLIAAVLLLLGFFPQWLIPDVAGNSEQWNIASALLIILALSCPIIIGQRILNMVFTIRVEDYKYQRIIIVGSLVKILSAFYFFRDGHYELVKYFLCYQVINLLVVAVAFWYIKRYGYTVSSFIKSFRFDKKLFEKTKNLSGTSFILVICMIFYYELDQVVISRFMGIEIVADYAMALSVMSFVRTFMSLLYAPYSARYNHYSGMKDDCGLKKFTEKIILGLAPVVCCFIVLLSIFSKPFVFSWVGDSYSLTPYLVSIMVFSFVPNFVSTPVNSYFVAKEENTRLIKLSIANVVIYWCGILITANVFGIYSFAVMKSLSPIMLVLWYWILIKKDFGKNGEHFIPVKDLLQLLIPVLLFCVVIGLGVKPYMDYEHNKIYLLFNLLIMAGCFMSSMFVLFLTNKQVRLTIRNMVKK